jgi:hypothetical protein
VRDFGLRVIQGRLNDSEKNDTALLWLLSDAISMYAEELPAAEAVELSLRLLMTLNALLSLNQGQLDRFWPFKMYCLNFSLQFQGQPKNASTNFERTTLLFHSNSEWF